MKTYFVLFAISWQTIDEWRNQSDQEKMKQQDLEMRDRWQKWLDTHKDSFIEMGSPLGKTKKVTKEGATDIRNDYNWYCIVQGESLDSVAAMFADHPQLDIPTSYMEIMEMPQMQM